MKDIDLVCPKCKEYLKHPNYYVAIQYGKNTAVFIDILEYDELYYPEHDIHFIICKECVNEMTRNELNRTSSTGYFRKVNLNYVW